MQTYLVQDFGQVRGAITDTDVAMESTRLARQQLRFEITGMFLAQGNLRPNVALSLLNNRIYRNKRNTIGKNKQAYN